MSDDDPTPASASPDFVIAELVESPTALKRGGFQFSLYLVWICLVLGAAPLAIYPFILLANVMSLAGEPSRHPVPLSLQLSSLGFLWGATLYPIAYFLCAARAIQLRHTSARYAMFMAVAPLLYLTAVVGLFYAWMLTSVD